MYKKLTSNEDLDQIVEDNRAVLVYFSTETCNVCKVLKPKVAEMLQQEFPEIERLFIDVEHFPQLAAKHSVFTVPTLLVYMDGREQIRKSRNIGLSELRKELSRPYSLLF